MAIRKNAVYRGGVEFAAPSTIEESGTLLADDDVLAWVGLDSPSDGEIESAVAAFAIDDRALEESRNPHYRSKTKRYGSTLYTSLLAARYDEQTDEVIFSEFHLFTGTNYVVTIRHDEMPDLVRVRRDLERNPEELRLGPEAVLYAVLRQVMDEFIPILAGLLEDIDQIEDRLFAEDMGVSRKIFTTSREVIAFQRATHPLALILDRLAAGYEKFSINPELRSEIDELQGQASRVIEQVDGLRFVIHSAMDVYATMNSQRQNQEMRDLAQDGYSQNEEVKRISAWAAILFAPTLIASIFGMNFVRIPLLDSRWGFEYSLAMMAASSLAIWASFKRKHWL